MWKEKYKIGVENIDTQHEELFHRVSDFVVSLRREGEWEDKLAQVKETLAFMQNYVVIHFDDEEAYQEKVNYPGKEQHRLIHEQFKNEVGEFAARFEEQGYNEQLVQRFAGKLLAWLINHVAASDQKIADYVKSLGGVNHEG